jgi:hypothetical protein
MIWNGLPSCGRGLREGLNDECLERLAVLRKKGEMMIGGNDECTHHVEGIVLNVEAGGAVARRRKLRGGIVSAEYTGRKHSTQHLQHNQLAGHN